MLTFLASLPQDRQQPNLLFAAVRNVVGLPSDGKALVDAIDRKGSAVSAVMKTRTTQTNEPARCAVLLPVLARLPQPIAIVRSGRLRRSLSASGSLWLRLRSLRLKLRMKREHTRRLFPVNATNLHRSRNMPDVQWRRGLDLNPLDVASTSDMEWLETLVWPEQQGRRERLRAAIDGSRVGILRWLRGAICLKDLEALLWQVPPGLTTVVFHTAVLAYVNERGRQQFRHAMLASDAVWISNEAPGIFPEIASKLSSQVRQDRFLLSVDGEPVASTAPHGQSLDWIDNG